MEKILLCGGAGFIGSHIAETYLAAGYELIIVDDLSTGAYVNIEHIVDNAAVTFYEVDVLDRERMDEIFDRHRPDIINNHVAQKSVPYSMKNPSFDNALNIEVLIVLIELVEKYEVRKFISASSGGALSKEIMFDGDTSKETDVPQLTSPYAITKYAGEKYLHIFAQSVPFSYIGLRYANVYGPRQVATGDCGVIPIFLNNIIQNKPSTLMTYADMPRGCTRDYVYVEDIAAFNLLAAQMDTTKNDVYNIGMETEFAMLDIYEELTDVFESDAPINIVGPRVGDMKRSVLDCSKVRKDFAGWMPRTSLREGLTRVKKSQE